MAAIISFPIPLLPLQISRQENLLNNAIENGTDLGSREYHIRSICLSIERLLDSLQSKVDSLNTDALTNDEDRKELTEAIRYFTNKIEKATREIAIFLA